MSNFDPIGTVAFFRERQRAEALTTRKVLGAMTPAMLEHRLHPESATIGSMAWTIVRCTRICVELTQIRTTEVPRDPQPTLDELLLSFDSATSEFASALLRMTQQQWEEMRIVTAGLRTLLEQPLGSICWLFHVDAIHHRGQLSVFLRPFGAKVPSIYGPSGDSQP